MLVLGLSAASLANSVSECPRIVAPVKQPTVESNVTVALAAHVRGWTGSRDAQRSAGLRAPALQGPSRPGTRDCVPLSVKLLHGEDAEGPRG